MYLRSQKHGEVQDEEEDEEEEEEEEEVSSDVRYMECMIRKNREEAVRLVL